MIDYASWVAQAEERLAEIEQERARLLAIIENARALAPTQTDSVRFSSRTITVRRRKRASASGSVMDDTRSAVSDILASKGEPIETRDLVPLVKERGVAVGGKDDVATLSARLSNSGDYFKLHRGVGWWFVDRPLPGAYAGFEEAEGRTVLAQPSASKQETEGGESDAAAIDRLTS